MFISILLECNGFDVYVCWSGSYSDFVTTCLYAICRQSGCFLGVYKGGISSMRFTCCLGFASVLPLHIHRPCNPL